MQQRRGGQRRGGQRRGGQRRGGVAHDAAARELLTSVFYSGRIGGVALDDADADAEEVRATVVDVVLVAVGVRDACLFSLVTYRKKSLNAAVLEACATLGVDAMRLTLPEDERTVSRRRGFETFFAFRRGDAEMERVAAAHKACFGASSEWTEERLRACYDAGKALGVDALTAAGKAFGYLNPSPRDSDGSIDFFVSGLSAKGPVHGVMGPQSVRLSDHRVGRYVRDRCRDCRLALRRLVGDAFPNVTVGARVRVD